MEPLDIVPPGFKFYQRALTAKGLRRAKFGDIASRAGITPTYLSMIFSGRHTISENLEKRLDEILTDLGV